MDLLVCWYQTVLRGSSINPVFTTFTVTLFPFVRCTVGGGPILRLPFYVFSEHFFSLAFMNFISYQRCCLYGTLPSGNVGFTVLNFFI